MVSGVFWMAIQKYTGVFVQLLVSAILARLLTPENFGVIAISTVIIAFFGIFSNMGMGSAVVQNKNLAKKDLRSIFTFTIYTGVGLAVIFFAGSYPIAKFYGDEQLIPICQLLSINLLFSTWDVVPGALIQKAKRFKFIAIRTFSLQVICGILAVTAAYHGFGVYSLLISPIVTSIALFIIDYRQNPLYPVAHINWASLRKIYNYSFFLLLYCILNFFSRNLDKLIVGRFFTLRDLGYYEKSYRLMMLPLDYFTFMLGSVMHPILASLQDNYEELTSKYNKIVHFMAYISCTTGVMLYFAAEDAMLFIFGDQWGPAVPVFKIFALSLPLQMVFATTGFMFQASGKTNWMFYSGLCNTCCTVTGFLVATFCFGTIESIAWAWDITNTINTISTFAVLYKIVLEASLRTLVRQFIKPMLCASVACLLLICVDAVKPSQPHVINLVIYGIISLSVLLPFLYTSGLFNLKLIKNKLTKQKTA